MPRTLQGKNWGLSFAAIHREGDESLSTILNGCGRAKIDVGIYFIAYSKLFVCHDETYKSCYDSFGTILVNLDGKKIGNLSLRDEEFKPKEETKVLEFTFHQGSKFELLLGQKVHPVSNNYPSFKFKSFNIECFSKCE